MNFIKTVNKVRDFFPSPLPQGLTEFNTWSASLIDTYDFPDNDSIRFALSTMIMHLDATAAYKPKRYFALTVKTGMAKQVAAQVFQDIKLAQQEAEAKAASELKLVVEAPTDQGAATTNVHTI